MNNFEQMVLEIIEHIKVFGNPLEKSYIGLVGKSIESYKPLFETKANSFITTNDIEKIVYKYIVKVLKEKDIKNIWKYLDGEK